MKCILHSYAGMMLFLRIALWRFAAYRWLILHCMVFILYASEPIPGRLNLDLHIQMLIVRGTAFS